MPTVPDALKAAQEFVNQADVRIAGAEMQENGIGKWAMVHRCLAQASGWLNEARIRGAQLTLSIEDQDDFIDALIELQHQIDHAVERLGEDPASTTAHDQARGIKAVIDHLQDVAFELSQRVRD